MTTAIKTTVTKPTPHPLASRYLDVNAMPWAKTSFPGIDIKLLYEDKERGMLTALLRWAPGSELPLHEHVEIEQSFVLEGTLEDDEGVCAAGNYVWRPAGSRHVARAPNGCLVLAFLLKPNLFLESKVQHERGWGQ